MAEEKEKRLSYDEIVMLEQTAKKLTGKKIEHWVDDKCICATCTHGQVMRRHHQNNRVIFCSDLGQFVPGDIAECNSYHNYTTLTLPQMTSIAIILDPRADKYRGYL